MLLAALVGALMLALASSAQADTYFVNTTADIGDDSPGDGDCATDGRGCTLRAATEEASSNNSPSDVINVPPGTYVLDNAEALVIEDDMTIVGASARNTIVRADTDKSGDGLDRVFDLQGTGTSATISGLGIANGQATSGFFGGNIRSEGTLVLRNSTVSGGRASSGGGISNVGGRLTVENSTIVGNRAPDGGGDSGAIQNFSPAGPLARPATLIVRNSTITGNSARLAGGIFSWGDPGTSGNQVSIQSSTIVLNASNEDPVRGGGGGLALENGTAAGVVNTIIAFNASAGAPLNCTRGGGSTLASGGHNLESATDCGFTAAGDRRSTNPLLGPLANNGGPTNTHALLGGSPARDAGLNGACPATDQRGVPRPLGAACDIGAFEAALPLVPALDSDRDGLPDSRDTCPVDRGPAPSGCPAPVLGRRFNVFPVRGDVYISLPPTRASAASAGAEAPIGVRSAQTRTVPGIKGRRFVPLVTARQLPVGSILDTRRGSVRVVSARDSAGRAQSGTFAAGVFQVLQSRARRSRGLTEMRLKGSSFRNCRVRARRSADVVSTARRRLSRRAKRRLRANARGRFRTRGRYAAATVRGTIWTTTDRCDGTLVKVRRGRVVVRSLRGKRRSRSLRRGKGLLVRAPGA